MGLFLAVLCAAASSSSSVLPRLLDPDEAVHFTFVEQETRSYDRRGTGAMESPYVDPWGRPFVCGTRGAVKCPP